MKTITLKVTGMGCKKCVAKVQNALNEVVGVMEATVSLENNNAIVECLDSTTKEDLINSIVEAGFNAE